MADDARNTISRVDPYLRRRIATIRIPGRLWGLASRGNDVLVVSVPTRSAVVSGPYGPRLLRRVDVRTNRISPPLVRLQCDPGIAIGRGSVWTTDPCRGRLVRREPTRLRPTGSIRIPRWKTPLVGFGSVWLVGGNVVQRVDPRTLRIVAHIKARGATGAVGEGAVWVLDQGDGNVGTLRRVDPTQNRLTDSVTVRP